MASGVSVDEKEKLLTLITSPAAAGAASAGSAGAAVPIYFASTHGVYDLTVNGGNVEYITVPDNTYVFEASSVGEATLSNIDEPLWELISNRAEFAAYLDSDPSATDPVKRQVIKNLCYYKPGDRLYKRTLILEDNNEYDYQWGYYKFSDLVSGLPLPTSSNDEESGEKKAIVIPEEPPNPPYTDVMKSFRQEHFPAGKTRLRSFERIDTGSDIRFITETRRRENYGGPAIFIFSSCASFWSSNGKTSKDIRRDKAMIVEIGRNQQLLDYQFHEMGFRSGKYNHDKDEAPLLKGRYARRAKGVSNRYGPERRLIGDLEQTVTDQEEEEYMKQVGAELTRYVKPRFNMIKTPPGAATLFIEANGHYVVAINKENPVGDRTWWTTEQIESILKKGTVPIYVNIAGEFKQITTPAGIYTGRVGMRPGAIKAEGSYKGGGKRIYRRKFSKRVNRFSRHSRPQAKHRQKTRRTR